MHAPSATTKIHARQSSMRGYTYIDDCRDKELFDPAPFVVGVVTCRWFWPPEGGLVAVLFTACAVLGLWTGGGATGEWFTLDGAFRLICGDGSAFARGTVISVLDRITALGSDFFTGIVFGLLIPYVKKVQHWTLADFRHLQSPTTPLCWSDIVSLSRKVDWLCYLRLYTKCTYTRSKCNKTILSNNVDESRNMTCTHDARFE